MTYNLTDETKALLQKKSGASPIVIGANQYKQSALPSLSKILSNQRTTQLPMQTQQTNNSASTGIGDLLNGGVSLINGLGGLMSKGDMTSGGITGEPIESDNGGSGSAISDAINGVGNAYSLYDTIGSFTNSGGGATGSAAGGYGGLIGAGLGGLQGFAREGDYKDGLQGMFGVNSDSDSDVMQSLKGATNGAMTGASVGGPWGALIGGVLGLGSSFLDDI